MSRRIMGSDTGTILGGVGKALVLFLVFSSSVAYGQQFHHRQGG